MNYLRNIMLVVLALLLASTDARGNHNCAGKVETVDIASNGMLQAAIVGMGVQQALCSLKVDNGHYTPDMCRYTMNLLLAAQLAKKDIRLHFTNDANPSCAKGHFAQLDQHGLYYVQIED